MSFLASLVFLALALLGLQVLPRGAERILGYVVAGIALVSQPAFSAGTLHWVAREVRNMQPTIDAIVRSLPGVPSTTTTQVPPAAP